MALSALSSDSLENLVSYINSCQYPLTIVDEGALSKPNISDTPAQHVQAFLTTGISEACQT